MRASGDVAPLGGAAAVCTSVCTPLAEHELEAAIASVTRALAATDDPQLAGELVAERRTLREELQAHRRAESVRSGDVVPIGRGAGRRRP